MPAPAATTSAIGGYVPPGLGVQDDWGAGLLEALNDPAATPVDPMWNALLTTSNITFANSAGINIWGSASG
jgi:hypothetical protein